MAVCYISFKSHFVEYYDLIWHHNGNSYLFHVLMAASLILETRRISTPHQSIAISRDTPPPPACAPDSTPIRFFKPIFAEGLLH